MVRVFTRHTPKPVRGTRIADRTASPRPGEPVRAEVGSPEAEKPKEIGGPSGPEPTRYGDWERKGICVDF